MEFNKAYNREEFLTFLKDKFLPEEDFVKEETVLPFPVQTKYSTKATRLGACHHTLDLEVYEIRHTSKHDARVGLSKEAFRLLAEEGCARALVLFVPEDDNSNYRFSLIEITLNIKEDSGKVDKSYSDPHRYSYYLGKGIAYHTPNKYLNEKGRVIDKDDLRERFSVEVLTKEFYSELSDWYAWAVRIIRFPNDITTPLDDAKFNQEGGIRLITRLIFVWFLKQRHLVPDEFFDEKYIAEHLIDGFNPHQEDTLFGKSYTNNYYRAILQNLFFAMLNCPITKEGSDEITERKFKDGRSGYDDNKLMRYKDLFKDPDLFVKLANETVPFLNGGLFDCLDDKDNGMYYDGFSERTESIHQLCVPDFLFFGEEAGKNIDLSEFYGDKNKKKVSARGIIDILKRYNFTVEENTPFDQEVSLDPELLGKVFENLLASYNPETQNTARKQTGSFYTPREIVQYMVDESLVAHLKRTVGEELELIYRQLLQYTDDPIDFTDDQRKSIMESLYNCKILDPACGSGAFPMGVLQQMVHILGRIDPDNVQWKEMMMDQAIDETTEAFKSATKEERQEQIADIERSFDEGVNRPDYARKLYLIENCIYGVDIQPIAIQISKLRFFISLVVDQKTNADPTDNFGIRPLPNLEAKFVAANTLIGITSDLSLADQSKSVQTMKQQLKMARHKIFSAKTVRTKRKYKQQVNDLRIAISCELESLGFITETETSQLASWDMFDQNASSSFFDSDWMFGVKGFDIVIGNPPYIDSETMTKEMPEMRKIYSSSYTCAKGNWDMFIPFIQKGSSLAHSNGSYIFIVPNKIVAAKYANKIRELIEAEFLIEIRDYSKVDVFENADVYPCTVNVSKVPLNSPVTFTTMSNRTDILYSFHISQERFHNVGFWDVFFQEPYHYKVLNKYFKQQSLSNRTDITILGAATVSEAYVIKECIFDLESSVDSVKIINTGTIDPYINLWGISRMQYIKGQYTYPRILLSDLKNMNETRLKQALSPKIIVAGMSKRIEAVYDKRGEYLAGKSTTIILSTREILLVLLAIINSKFVQYCINKQFNSLKMAGGFFTIGTREVSSIHIPNLSNTALENYVNAILAIKELNPNADISNEEKKIDCIVYKLYGLTYDEVKIVDPKTPITKETYDN